MNAIIILIPVTLVLLGCAIALFIWAVRNDQFRNLDTPGIIPVMDATDEAQDDTADNDVKSDGN